MKDELNNILQQNEAWRQGLKQLETENVSFKTRLADILATDFTKGQLENLEFFQTRFLKMDDQITLLRHEIRECQELLDQLLQTNDVLTRTIDLHKGLQEKIFSLHENFYRLQTDFNSYLSDSFPEISIKHI